MSRPRQLAANVHVPQLIGRPRWVGLDPVRTLSIAAEQGADGLQVVVRLHGPPSRDGDPEGALLLAVGPLKARELAAAVLSAAGLLAGTQR